MITLSPRLHAAANFVPRSETVADVGTDHGYLPLWLLEHQRAQRVFASDIHALPLERARQNAAASGFSDRVRLELCDGLQYPGAEAADAVTICGMGGETMISILAAAPWTRQGRALILQPQSKRRELEQWLCQNGYGLQDARLCRDAGKLYLVLSVLGGCDGAESTEALLLRSHDPLLPEYLALEQQKLTHALRGMEQAARDTSAELRTLRVQLTAIEAYQKEVGTW